MCKTEKIFDCVVVGAGPIGSYFSRQIADAGLSTILLEEHQEIGKPVHCTGVIGAGSYDFFNLSKNAKLKVIDNLKFISPNFNTVTLNKDQSWAYIVDRSMMDKELACSAEKSGVTIQLDSKVIDVKEEKESVKVHLKDGRIIIGKSCILTTGSFDSLPYRLGFLKPWYFLKGAQVEVGFKMPENNNTIDIYLGRELCGGDFIWTVPISENRARIGICSRYNAKNYLENFLSKPDIKNRLLSSYRIHGGIVPVGGIEELGTNFCRIFTLGDAAGHVKPTTAGGIALGLKVADVLKKSIVDGIKTSFSDSLISKKYYKKVRKKIGIELLIGDFFRKIFLKLEDNDWDEIIKIANDKKLLTIINKKSEFDKHSKLILWFFRNSKYRKIFLRKKNVNILNYLKRMYNIWI